MLELRALERLLDLKERSYGLFLWLNESMKRGRRSFGHVSDSLSLPDAAYAWIRANIPEFPAKYRPDVEETEPFAHLFVSYLSTSFEVVDGAHIPKCGGCWCCGYWVAPRHLRVRNPGRAARNDARQLKLLYLRGLADELGIARTDAELADLLPSFGPELAMATYVVELDRRSKFRSQGEGVLVLWREFAWTRSGSPRRNFRLTAKAVLEAERSVVARLQTPTSGRSSPTTP